MAMPNAEYEAILALVRSWPANQRLHLVQDVMGTLAATEPAPRQTLQQARGLLKTQAAPPSDQQVDAWLEAHRAERYGL
jgi:hypothetical protein